jgi:hypothetical protein
MQNGVQVPIPSVLPIKTLENSFPVISNFELLETFMKISVNYFIVTESFSREWALNPGHLPRTRRTPP